MKRILSGGNKRFPVYVGALMLFSAGILLLIKGSVTPAPIPSHIKTTQSPTEPAQNHTAAPTDIVTCTPPENELPSYPPYSDFVGFMESELESTGTVGAAYTIVHGGRVEYTGVYGVRKKGEAEPVTQQTLFRLASVSKGFAGALACQLEMEGILNLDDRVIEYYPAFRLKDSVNTVDMTLRHLLSHTTGLVPFAFDNLVEANQALDGIAARLHEVDISGPPGELYGYQNVMFSLLDPIFETVTGQSYPELLEERLFRPLGMDRASAGGDAWDRYENVAYPHARGRNGYIALPLHHGYYNVLPAAGVNASIEDMGLWLQALMGADPEHLPDTVRNMLASPVIYTPLKSRYTRNWKPFRDRYYSLGWRVYFYRDHTIVYHGGYIRGYRAEIGFCPELGTGIAFMQNSPNGLASRCVPAFFDRLLDFQEMEKAVQEVFDSAPGKVSIEK